MSTAYIAGAMSGHEDFNYPAFHAAEEQLRDEGYEVNNPARNFGGDTSLPYTTYIEQAIRDVLASDWIFCLPGWRKSVGARTEVHVAATLGKPVYERAGVGGKRLVKVDKFGTPSAGLPEALTPEQARRIAEAFLPEPIRLFPTSSEIAEAVEQATALLPPPGIHPHSLTGIALGGGPAAEKAKAVLGDMALARAVREVTDYQGAVDGGGYKGSMDDPRKLPIWLVPNALIDGCARALQHGAVRYAPNNWRKGMHYSEVYSALQRHLLAWNEDEDIDPDSGLNHLDHAAACLGFLSEYIARPEYAKFDNRLKRQKAGIVRAIKEGVAP